MITFDTRVQALRNLGYATREAEFLCLAALHSGYFLRRQYRAFLGTKPGAADDLLVAKIRNLGHGRVLTLGFKTQLCHLSARPFYRAIGQENNRHRRMRSDLSIKTKLMILDYVLASPGQTWLATEEERVDYFCCRLAIEPGVLPRKIYRSQATRPPSDTLSTSSRSRFRRSRPVLPL
jgi:hypothetical protein